MKELNLNFKEAIDGVTKTWKTLLSGKSETLIMPNLDWITITDTHAGTQTDWYYEQMNGATVTNQFAQQIMNTLFNRFVFENYERPIRNQFDQYNRMFQMADGTNIPYETLRNVQINIDTDNNGWTTQYYNLI